MKNKRRLQYLFLLSIVIAGAILRLYKWNGYSFWHDEVIWLITGRDNLLDILKDAIWILRPPLFMLLIHMWSLLGNGEFLLRLLPFVFGVSTILVTYKVGKLLFNKKIGLIAALFVSFSPFHIYYSQELTHYTLTALLALCSVYYFILSVRKNSTYVWVMFVFFTCLSIYTSYYLLFLLISENLFFLLSYIKYKKLLRKWLLSNVFIVLLYIPWLLMLPRQISLLHTSPSDYFNWMPTGSPIYILQAFRLFNVGYNADFILNFLASLIFFPLFFIGIVSHLRDEKEQIKLLVLWLLAPMVLSLLFSMIMPTFIYRNFIFVIPAYYILIARGVVKIKRYYYMPIFYFIALAGLSLTNYYKNVFPYPEYLYRPGVHPKKDNRTATEYVIKNFNDGDIVIHTSNSTVFPYIYYSLISKHLDKDELKNLIFQWEWESRLVVRNADAIPDFLSARGNNQNKRVWLFFSSWEPQKLTQDKNMVENKIKEWMDENFEIVGSKKFTGIEIYLYNIISPERS